MNYYMWIKVRYNALHLQIIPSNSIVGQYSSYKYPLVRLKLVLHINSVFYCQFPKWHT